MSSEQAKDSAKRPRVKTWKVLLGLALVLPVVAVQWLLHSSYVVRVVVDRVGTAMPGLEIDNLSGNVADGLRLDAYYDDGVNVYAITDLNIQVSVSCLFRKHLCIDKLHVVAIDINLGEPRDKKEETSPEPVQLPTITLPVSIGIDSLTVDTLRINNHQDNTLYQIGQIQSALSFADGNATVEDFTAVDNFCQWRLDGEVTLQNAYPLQANLACQSVNDYGEFDLALSESVANLHVDGTVSANNALLPANNTATLAYTIEPLAIGLPMTLSAQLPATTAVKLNGDTITVRELSITANSKQLQTNFELRGAATHSRWPDEHQLQASGLLTLEQLQLQRFSWLLPEGKVQASGELRFTDGLVWQGPINWQNVDLGYWQSAVAGTLSGAIETQVDYQGQALSATAKIAKINGTLNDQPVSGNGTVKWRQQQLQLQQTRFTIGGGNIAVDGTTNFEELNLTTRFDIPNLQHWIPAIEGGLEGNLALQGTVSDPSVKGQLVATQLHYQDILSDTVNVDVDWRALDSLDNNIVIRAETVQQQDFFGRLNLDWHGSFADHRWQLQLTGINNHQDKKINTRCSGSWQPPAWSTDCETINLAFDYFDTPQSWQLSAPLRVSINTETQQLSLSEFCLSAEAQSICNPQALNINAQNPGTVRLQANNMSSAWLQPWLPTSVTVDGDWRASLALADPFNQQSLSAEIRTDNMAWRWQQGEAVPLTVQLQTLALNWQWQLAAQTHNFDWRLQTRDNGSSRGNLSLNQEQLDGSLSLNQWQLAAFSRLLLNDPQDRVEALVNAQFNVSGNLSNPLVNGELSVDQGAVKTTMLPMPIQNIDLDLNVVDNTAKLDGKFTANDSPGAVGGEFVWRPDTWRANLSLTAENLAYQPERNIQVHVSPDVQLQMDPTSVSLTGNVKVPRADIEIEQLPEQAATVSADTVIVGREPQTQRQLVKTDLQLQLGDKVKFAGFGLTTQITGNLRLRQNPGELLQGQGVLQLQEGRYQKYGQDLRIRNGDLVFVSDLENPQLRLEAIREPTKTEDEVIVGLRASGSAQRPDVTLFSEPPMTQQEQMNYLIYGVAPGTDRQSTDPSLLAAQQALTYALESSAGESFTRFAGETLGIRDLQVTTDSSTEGTQIGLRGYLTPNLLVRYGVGVFDSVNSLTLQYQLKKNLYLEAVSGKGNALDLFWSFEKD